MMKATEIGIIGEKAAEHYLKSRGWNIVSTNYSARGGEIDIIGFRFGTLVYFEVKTRSNSKFGTPAEAVDEKKIARIKKAARDFLHTYASSGKISVYSRFWHETTKTIRKERIDVIEIYLSQDKKVREINHIKDWGSQL